KLDDARTWFDQDLRVAKALAATDPSNTLSQRDLAFSYERLGDVTVRAGKLDDARTWFDKALAIRKARAVADPNNATWQRDLCFPLARLAEIAREPTAAIKHLDEARLIYGQLQREGSFRGDEQFAQLGRYLDQLSRDRTT